MTQPLKRSWNGRAVTMGPRTAMVLIPAPPPDVALAMPTTGGGIRTDLPRLLFRYYPDAEGLGVPFAGLRSRRAAEGHRCSLGQFGDPGREAVTRHEPGAAAGTGDEAVGIALLPPGDDTVAWRPGWGGSARTSRAGATGPGLTGETTCAGIRERKASLVSDGCPRVCRGAAALVARIRSRCDHRDPHRARDLQVPLGRALNSAASSNDSPCYIPGFLRPPPFWCALFFQRHNKTRVSEPAAGRRPPRR